MRLLICAALVCSAALASTVPALADSCSARIAYVQRIIDRDVKIGFVDKKVHDDMGRDLAAAAQACGAGNAAKGEALISATQRKHGYPVSGLNQ